MEIFRFAHPGYLYLLIIVPVLAFIHLYFSIRRKRSLEKFGDMKLLNHLMPDVSERRIGLKFYLLLLAFIAVIFTIAGPQFGSKLETVKRKGIEIMIALDVSNSMNARDIEPSRLERAKLAISQLVDRLHNDRIGMIVFAGQAYVQLPITSDYPSAKMFLSGINTDMVPVQGTAIGAAINLAANSFSPLEGVNRVIVVITDGENHEDDAVKAAAEALEKGIRVYTVGMGTTKGSPIPVSPSKTNDFIKDREGNVVITKIDETSLKTIAGAGEGAYIPANNIRDGLNSLLDELDNLEKTELESKVYSEYNDRFQYVAFLALLLLLAELFLLERKNSLLKGVNIFNRKKEQRDFFIEPK
jgi:Ca-activated chloride channel family protein